MPPFFFAGDRQPNATPLNLGQWRAVMQREMPVHGEPKKLTDAPWELVKMCEDELDAVRLCIQLSKFSHEFIGKQLGIDKGHFSRILQGMAGFPTHKRLSLMRLCGNRAPVQYEVMHIGAGEGDVNQSLVEELKADKEALSAENLALKGALAAVLGSQHQPNARAA